MIEGQEDPKRTRSGHSLAESDRNRWQHFVHTVMNLTFTQEGKTFLENTGKYEPFSEDPAAVLNYHYISEEQFGR